MPQKDPEVRKAYLKEYNSNPVNKARAKAYHKEYNSNPVNKARKKAYDAEYHSNPVNKARAKALADRPKAKAKSKANRKARREKLITLPSGNIITTTRADQLKTVYKLTPKQYDDMLIEQDNEDPITGKEFSNILKPKPKDMNIACVDHNPKTGRVRALLSKGINAGLGHFNHDPELLRNAADYCEYHENIDNLLLDLLKEEDNEQKNN